MSVSQQDCLIIGGGITGLSAAYYLQNQQPEAKIMLLEKADRIGGKIRTDDVQDCIIERGPDSFLSRKHKGIELCQRLQLGEKLRNRLPQKHAVSVRVKRQLHTLPTGLSGLIPTDLNSLKNCTALSVSGKQRFMNEIFIPPQKEIRLDESIADFAVRRFGKEAFDYLIEPLMGGIYAGHADKMSLAATFPHLRALELEYGSVIKGLQKKSSESSATTAFLSLERGMGQLIEALENQLTVDIQRNAAVCAVLKDHKGYTVELQDGRCYRSQTLLITTPAFITGRLLERIDKQLAHLHRCIRYTSVVTVVLAFDQSAIHRLPASYGYVVPSIEGGPVIACTYVSNKWPQRVDQETVLLRFYLGRSNTLLADEEEGLLNAVQLELQQTLNIQAQARFHRIYRWPNSMPQYDLGHLDRVKQITIMCQKQHPGLFLAGAAYGGVGIPDCIEGGESAAKHCIRFLERNCFCHCR